MQQFPFLVSVQCLLLAASLAWYFIRRDELLLLFNALFLYFGSFRYYACTWGIGNWGKLEDKFGLPDITDGAALFALGCFALGQVVFTSVYMMTQRRTVALIRPKEDTDPRFLDWLRPYAMMGATLFIPLAILVRSSVMSDVYGQGKNAAFQVSSYKQLLPMGLIGCATLVMCLWRLGGLRNAIDRTWGGVILVAVAYLSFSNFGRFQFVGLFVAGMMVAGCTLPVIRRMTLLAGLLVVGGLVFSAAGSLRDINVREEGRTKESAFARIMAAEDGNMIDGFVYLESVYPRFMPHEMGKEHLGVLLRPIPRAIWPGKPTGGGYAKYFGMIDPTMGFTIGISPSLIGSFYSEGGVMGVIVFAAIYAFVLGRIVRWSTETAPFAGLMTRAMIAAALVPLARGGDLPGVYAWLGMAFWPCFLVLWTKRKYFRAVGLERLQRLRQRAPLRPGMGSRQPMAAA